MEYKKRIRLKEFAYKGTYRYFVTICSLNKREIFTNNNNVLPLIEMLKETAIKYCFNVWVYTFMPNYVHLLVEGKNETADFKKFSSVFKQKSGYRFWKEKQIILWQENYYEHILRKEEETLVVVKYIINNPLRKMLVKDYRDYPYSGSFLLDIRNL